MIARKDCEDCNGSGKIEVENIHFGRPYWKDGKIVNDIFGKGDWHLAQCPCVGEDE